MTIEKLIADLDRRLKQFQAKYKDLELRPKVLLLVEILKKTRALNKASIKDAGIDANSAGERLRLYMIQFVGVPLGSVELEVVSGISEYARRIRELRVQDGYKIIAGPKEDEESGLNLKKGEYLLVRAEPDHKAARRWHLANRIRREKGSAQSRMLKYFQANVGQIVTTEELAYVANDNKNFQRRVRELRTEEGYAVATMFTGRPDLRQGEYVLESAERIAEKHDRNIPKAVERAVYERDNSTCVICGWSHEKWTRKDPRFLELHHIEHHKAGGPNSDKNLIVLCNKCHDDVHANRVVPPKPKD